MALHRISSDHHRTPYPAPLLLRYNALRFFLVNMLCMAQCTSAASTARGGFDGPAQLQGATVSPDWGGDITSSAPFGSQFFNDKELKRWQEITAISQHTTHPTGQNMNPPLHNATNRRHMQEQPLVDEARFSDPSPFDYNAPTHLLPAPSSQCKDPRAANAGQSGDCSYGRQSDFMCPCIFH